MRRVFCPPTWQRDWLYNMGIQADGRAYVNANIDERVIVVNIPSHTSLVKVNCTSENIPYRMEGTATSATWILAPAQLPTAWLPLAAIYLNEYPLDTRVKGGGRAQSHTYVLSVGLK